ncbi:MAG: SpoIIE family protein phosphatase [Ruminococcus sp.]|nr:SpoIIE family protein phosphatase [Ruminococcus sp.]
MNIKSFDLSHVSVKDEPAFRQAAAALLSFAASAGHIGAYHSFVCAGLAAILPSASPAVFIGSTLYYLLFCSFTEGLVQLCSILVISVIMFAFSHSSFKDSPAFTASVCSGVLLIFNFAVSAAAPVSSRAVIIGAIGSVMTGCFVFSCKTLQNELSLTRMLSLGGKNSVHASVIFVTVISLLASFDLFFNPGRVIGCTVLLILARRSGSSGGAAVGALTALAVLIGDPSLAVNTMLLATAGLVCGAFAELGVLALSVSFLAVCAVGLATVGGSDSVKMFIDASLGSIAFAAIPSGALRRASEKLFGGRDASDTISRATASRLRFAASSLGEIRQQLALVSAAMDKKLKQAPLSETVFDCMCRSCEYCCICHRSAPASAEGFQRLEKQTLSYSGLSDDDVRRSFPGCRFPELVSDSFNYAYKSYVDGRAAQLHIAEMRSLVSEQLCVTEDILSDLSCRVGQIRSVDKVLSERVRDAFSRLGCKGAAACVYLDEAGFRHIEVLLSSGVAAEPMQLAVMVSDICDCFFDLPSVSVSDRLTRLLFSELPAYTVTSGSFSASSTENGYSGDTYSFVKASSCECFAVLSDGMGTGKRARLDSMFAVSLASKLLTAGASMRSAHRLINSVLRVKGWDESFATLDILRFDLCSGAAELLKAGAAPTYLYRDGSVKRFCGDSMPVGMIGGCAPDEFSFKLFDGDTVIMTSDGVSEETVRNALEATSGVSPKVLAQKMGELAMECSEGGRRDDISIAVFGVAFKNTDNDI